MRALMLSKTHPGGHSDVVHIFEDIFMKNQGF
jgi:hypothetical protein